MTLSPTKNIVTPLVVSAADSTGRWALSAAVTLAASATPLCTHTATTRAMDDAAMAPSCAASAAAASVQLPPETSPSRLRLTCAGASRYDTDQELQRRAAALADEVGRLSLSSSPAPAPSSPWAWPAIAGTGFAAGVAATPPVGFATPVRSGAGAGPGVGSSHYSLATPPLLSVASTHETAAAHLVTPDPAPGGSHSSASPGRTVTHRPETWVFSM